MLLAALLSALAPSCAFGNGRAALPVEPAWTAVADWTSAALDVPLAPDDVQVWRSNTADVLRSQPELSLAPTLAEALARTAKLPPKLQERAAELFDRGRFRAQGPSDGSRILSSTEHEGEGVLGTFTGVHDLRGDRILSDEGRSFFVGSVDHELHAAVENKLYVRRRGDWELEFEAPERWESVITAASIGGTRLIGTIRGLYRKDAEGWNQRFFARINEIRLLDDKVHLATNRGLFVWHGTSWMDMGPGSWVDFAADVAGKLTIGFARRGIFTREHQKGILGGSEIRGWTDPDGRMGHAPAGDEDHYWLQDRHVRDSEGMRLLRRDGRTILTASDGVYEHGDGGWTRLVDSELGGIGGVTGFVKTAEGDHLVGEHGVWRLAPAPPAVPADWRSRIVEGLGALFVPKPSEPARSTEADEAAIRRGGRTIFTGLKK